MIAHVALEILKKLIEDNVVKAPAAMRRALHATVYDLDESITSITGEYYLPVQGGPKKRMRDGVDDLETFPNDVDENIFETLIAEVKKFLQKKAEQRIFVEPYSTEDPYKLWNMYGEDFPLLSPVAVYVLSIPPSSANVERLFSACAAISHDNQWRRSPKKLAIQIFLKYNYVSIKKDLFRYLRAPKK